MSSITLSEFQSEPERLKAYAEWLALPITKVIFELAENHVRDKFLSQSLPPTVEAGAQLHALHFGRLETLEFLQRGIRPFEEALEIPTASYGADQILLAEYGYLRKPTPTQED